MHQLPIIQFILLNILLLLRRLVHEGTPLDTVATAALGDISMRSDDVYNLSERKKEWICRLLKIGIRLKIALFKFVSYFLTGYLALEALEEDDEMSGICAYCGIIPDVVLGILGV